MCTTNLATQFCISCCSPCLGGTPKENTDFSDMVQEMGKGSMFSNFQRAVQILAFSLIGTEFGHGPLELFRWTSVQHSNVHEAGSCWGSSLCSQRFAWLLPFTISSASKKNWCYLLNRKLTFATEGFLCVYPLPVWWQQGVASRGCISSESEEIPSYWCLWSQIKVNLSSRKCDWKHYLTSSFTFSSLAWNDSLYLSG